MNRSGIDRDGFALVARRPLTVFVWGLPLPAPAFASFSLMLPMLRRDVRQRASACRQLAESRAPARIDGTGSPAAAV